MGQKHFIYLETWKEVDAWTQLGRFPLESVELCQFMPCLSFAKSPLLSPLTILFSRLHRFDFLLILSRNESSNDENNRSSILYNEGTESYKLTD